MQFLQIIGGLCGWSAFVCGAPPQNNWLFSQFISFTEAKEMYLEFSYFFSSGINYMNAHIYYVDSIISESERTNTNNYSPLYRLQGTATGDTHSLIRPDKKGFYLGFQDIGTCGQISRVIAYYTVCRGGQNKLVIHPQVATPPRNGPDEVFYAHCVPNAHNVTSLAVNAFAATSTCLDVEPEGAKCECNAGYQVSANGSACIRE